MPLPLRERPEVLEQLERELYGARLATSKVKVLVVGNGDALLINQIKQRFSAIGYQTDILGVNSSSNLATAAKLVLDTVFLNLPENKILYSDISSVARKMPKRFDYVFVQVDKNDPLEAVIKSSLMATQDDGMVFVRFYYGHNPRLINRMNLYALQVGFGIKAVIKTNRLPIGNYNLSNKTFILKRTDFDFVDRFTLGDLMRVRATEVMA